MVNDYSYNDCVTGTAVDYFSGEKTIFVLYAFEPSAQTLYYYYMRNNGPEENRYNTQRDNEELKNKIN
jgi:hypothetical protein